MKTKAKLTLAISTLSAVVLAAGVTSTFAWFTTRSQVQFDAGILTVSTMSKLTIEGMRVVSGATAADTGATTTKVIAQDSPLGAVSSATGEHFFAETVLGKPTEKYTAVDTQTALNTLKGAGNKYCDYVKYNFKITAAAADDGAKDLYVSITNPTISGDNIDDWYRIAIFTYADEELDNTPHTKDGSFAHTYAQTEATDANVITDVEGTTGSVSRDAVAGLITGVELKDNFQTVTASSSQASSSQTPSTKTAAASIFVCVAVWMEGSANADQNIAGGNTLQLDFTFALQTHA